MKALLAALLGSTLITADIQVIDGDTVRAGGHTYRLVGFDTPETGDRARCPSERLLAARATARLREIIEAGNIVLERVACACRPGTEGTAHCNYGRLCARLTVNGRDVGKLLISKGLAHEYVCGATGCPRGQGWRPPIEAAFFQHKWLHIDSVTKTHQIHEK